jgi:hypothetical protein
MLNHVNDLLDPISGSWDSDLVSECLWTADAAHVLSIPVNFELEDTWAWRLELKGLFSVKSVYKLHKTMLEHHGSATRIDNSGQLVGLAWKDIWSCPCPPNIKENAPNRASRVAPSVALTPGARFCMLCLFPACM